MKNLSAKRLDAAVLFIESRKQGYEFFSTLKFTRIEQWKSIARCKEYEKIVKF